jgi:hypothetical protein
MKDTTKLAKNIFIEKTGITPLSIKDNVGSMRGYWTVTLSRENALVEEVIKTFYGADSKPTLNGVELEFMGSVYDPKKIRFEIRKRFLTLN